MLFANTFVSGFALAGFFRNNRLMTKVSGIYSDALDAARKSSEEKASKDE